jgi:hypothetical protein
MSGTYSVTIQAPAPYLSVLVDEANPNADGDNNDNGLGIGGARVSSGPIDLTPGSEPVVIPSTGTSQNPTMDFGLALPMNLGNYVWYDTNDDGLPAGENPVAGVRMELYRDTNGDGQYTVGVDVLVSTTVTDLSGFYNFTNLVPGGYVVVITTTNFTAWNTTR